MKTPCNNPDLGQYQNRIQMSVLARLHSHSGGGVHIYSHLVSPLRLQIVPDPPCP